MSSIFCEDALLEVYSSLVEASMTLAWLTSLHFQQVQEDKGHIASPICELGFLLA
jgi:hypothetical protein